MPPRAFRPFRSAPAIAVAVAAACANETLMPPVDDVTREITVDASAGPAYLALDSVAQVVTVATPSASIAWDLAFAATTVSVNGGAAGPGGVGVYCLCATAGASVAEIQAMTPANQLAAFEAITAADIPAASAFEEDRLDPVIGGWYAGTGAGATVVAARSWIIRDGTVLAKLTLTGMTAPTAAAPGSVTFQFAVQPSAGAAFGATQTATVSPGAGPVYFDFTAGAVSTSAAWDLKFDGWTILTNGGVSGSGGMTAVLDTQTPFASIDAGYAATVPPQAYRADQHSGVFRASPWYRYNITGTDNQIWPVFGVYLLRRGSEVFKVQLTGYYSAAGAPRNITVRYAQLAR